MYSYLQLIQARYLMLERSEGDNHWTVSSHNFCYTDFQRQDLDDFEKEIKSKERKGKSIQLFTLYIPSDVSDDDY